MSRIMRFKLAILAVLAIFNQGSLADGNEVLLDHRVEHAKLEVKQRDVVISELASLLLHQYQGYSKSELVSILKNHPEAKKNIQYVSTEGSYVFFGSVVKFKFEDGHLSDVYW